jgi:hypothetical protein
MQTLSKSTPKARKAHWCDWCNRVIDPGEVYNRASVLGDDGFYQWVSCAHCMALVILCRDIHDQSWRDEGISEEDILEWEPGDLRDLRLKALWRKKWRRKDSSLYPVPTKVAS